MAAICLGAQGFFGRGIERFCLIRCEPFCQGFNLGRNSEERIHVLAAIIVLACNLADGYLVILGRSIEPRTLHFVDCHNIVSRDVFKWFNALFTWDDFVKISFSHHIEILTRSKDIAERLFYIHCAAQNAWSLSSLKNYLKEDIYSNRGSLPSNFLQVLPEAIYAVKATLAFKDEYMLEMVNLENVGEREQDWNEKVIENQIVTNIKQFILRFGNDFTFIDSQHRLIVAGEEMFADLVFFNRELNASVIVELKRGKFRPNYLGQLSGYLTVYDMTDKKPHENPSIGIVLCQDANRQFVEIMVRDYDKPMGVATYRTAQEMPENLRKTLPDIDKLQNLLSENDSKSETVR